MAVPSTMVSAAKHYDLEERTWKYAKDIRTFVSTLPLTLANQGDGKQLIRASGSVGANYIEANESLGKKDFAMKIKTCRKEAKESNFWLRLVDVGGNEQLDQERQRLSKEARELELIFGAILRNSQSS